MTLTPFNTPHFFYNGMRVFVAPPPPAKYHLSPDVMVSDKFRFEFNGWLAARFGRQPPTIKDGDLFINKTEGYIIGNAATVQRLKEYAHGILVEATVLGSNLRTWVKP